jgi:hypothetical protein
MNILKKFQTQLYFIKLFILLSLSSPMLHAQNSTEFNEKWSLGYQLNEIENNFGYGVHLQTPLLFHNASLKWRINRQYFSLIDTNDQSEDWLPYYNSMLSMVFYGENHGNIQAYSESGFALTIPPSEFNDRAVGLKGFGLFGMRVFLNSSFAFFFEAGGIGGSGSGNYNSISYNIDSGFFFSSGFTLNL